jgi:hypothetical protein
MKTYPSKEELEQEFSYNPETGIISRLNNKPKCKAEQEAGYLVGDKKVGQYRMVRFNYHFLYAHRVAWILANGDIPEGKHIDHCNHIRTDNRLENLRLVTRSENLQNQKLSKRNTSGKTGVAWSNRENKWVAKIGMNGKQIHLGYFTNKEDAVEARSSANKQYGYHQNHCV